MKKSSAKDASVFSDKQKALQKAARFRWFHAAIIAASFLLTLLGWYYAHQVTKTKSKERFDLQTTRVVSLIEERMQKYEDFLWGGVATLDANNSNISLEDWKTYSQSLKIETKYQGVNGIGIIDYIPLSDKARYLTEQREGRPDFRVHPPHEEQELFPITYIEPVAINAQAVGLDIAHETNRYESAKMARDTGLAQITGPITLVQDARRTPGFLFYAPFYDSQILDTVSNKQKHFRGMVYAPFIFDRLMEGTLKSESRLLGLTIMDGDTALFDENIAGNTNYDHDPLYTKTINIDIYGRNWTIDVQSKTTFREATGAREPLVILLGGLLIDALLIAIFALLFRSNQKAVNLANRLSNDQEAIASRLNNIVDNAADGIVTITEDGEIESFNRACEDIFGYSTEGILGQDIVTLIPELTSEFYRLNSSQTTSKTLSSNSQTIFRDKETLGTLKDGSQTILNVSISELNDHDRGLYNILVRDISDKKKTEQALQETMEDLVISNQELEKFAYVASHDLKSPLRAVKLISEWLEEDLDNVLDDENRERLTLLRSRISRMEKLLEALLNYSRAGKTYEETNLVKASDLVEDVKLTLSVPEDFHINIDKGLSGISIARMPLENIFHNLINNAIKHHDKDKGAISISGVAKKDNYVFLVSDDGPGIVPEFHEKVFEMFQTLKPRDSVEGSGMGLALVKRAVIHRGGEIDIQSSPGKGTTFKIIWPKTQKRRGQSGLQPKAD